jgi:hypothetical protein
MLHRMRSTKPELCDGMPAADSYPDDDQTLSLIADFLCPGIRT